MTNEDRSKPSVAGEKPLRIRVRDDGPLVIEGAIDGVFQIVDAQGRAFPLPTHKPLVALCRCGRSKGKPFCDGSHKEYGFSACDRAP